MLNKGLKEEYTEKLQIEMDTYNGIQAVLVQSSENLYKERKRLVRQLNKAYQYINRLKHTPEEINIQIEKIKLNLDDFENLLSYAEKHVNQVNLKHAITSSTSVVTGAGVAAFAPTVAMSVATTFGTASTGTAISALSGAASTNAALAWLGGGSIASSGGGMVAGKALLALAGPIGWTIGGVGLIGGVLSISGNNKQAAVHAMSNSAKIRGQSKAMAAISAEINKMSELSRKNKHGIRVMIDQLNALEITDYLSTTQDEKYLLGSFVNNVFSTTDLLNGIIGESGKFVNKELQPLIEDETSNRKAAAVGPVFDQTFLLDLIERHATAIKQLHNFGMVKPNGLVQHAIKHMAADIIEEDIVLLYNQSLTNRMDKGFILTKEELIVNQMFEAPYRLRIKEIEDVHQNETILTMVTKDAKPHTLKLKKNDADNLGKLLSDVIGYLNSIC